MFWLTKTCFFYLVEFDLDPDPDQNEKWYPDPNQNVFDPSHCISFSFAGKHHSWAQLPLIR